MGKAEQDFTEGTRLAGASVSKNASQGTQSHKRGLLRSFWWKKLRKSAPPPATFPGARCDHWRMAKHLRSAVYQISAILLALQALLLQLEIDSAVAARESILYTNLSLFSSEKSLVSASLSLPSTIQTNGNKISCRNKMCKFQIPPHPLHQE